jgi:molybdopterin-containing oxidoreductase family iron-sulfur binding subunit
VEPKHKAYWSHPAQKAANGLIQIGGDEFPGLEAAAGMRLNRRGFLGAVGFSFAAAALTGCTRAPVENAIPLLAQPPESVPGVPQYYASTCNGCAANCGVLVKVRDGRPIKLEGNPQHARSRGGLCAVGQASILGLYDKQRFRAPERGGVPTTWDVLDAEVSAQLAHIRERHDRVRVLTSTITSPALRASTADFLKQFANAKHVVYDVPSMSAIRDAHAVTHGARLLPSYDFGKAEVIVGFDADFLGTWISPVAFTAAYSEQRSPSLARPHMSYHVQFEPRMTVTGAKADRRYAVAPSETGALLSCLASHLAKRSGAQTPQAIIDVPAQRDVLDDLAERLWSARGKSFVVSGSNVVAEQVLVNYINHLLGNYGTTLSLEKPSLQAQGNDAELTSLLEEIAAGRVDALFVYGANPAYDFPRYADALRRVPLLVSLAERRDETAALSGYVAPDHHYLESWGDAEPVAGSLSLRQPEIRPLGQTRAALESFARWSGKQGDAYDLLRRFWQAEIHSRAKTKTGFDAFWDRSLHDGYVDVEAAPHKTAGGFNVAAVRSIAARRDETTVILYPSVAMLDGRHAYNPWLHELPDPISKVAWDNYASLAPATAARLGIAEGDVVRLQTHEGALELPAFIQPGQHESVCAVALGYGSRLSARFAKIGPQWLDFAPSVGPNGLVGVNAGSLIALGAGGLSYVSPVTLRKIERRQPLASTQTHNTLTVPENLAKFGREPRPIIQETTLAAFAKNPAAGVQEHAEGEKELWPADHENSGPRWGMAIDLARCTGCSGCVIACQAENNIPVVGKDEVRRNREMHWLRIDRYYAESGGQVDVAFQPLFCQQCGNAPCETVCPVVATVHSEDGLNQQVYNRCIGTRYCANNCPYKGRRFNWFDYAHDDVLQNLVLNPDVTVRSRGVMEKCTFCVQRIQLAKIAAREEGRSPADGEIQTACQQSCPAGAIVFGDLNDPNSRVSKLMKDPRRYRLLAELGVKPAVGFLTLVRNREGEEQYG